MRRSDARLRRSATRDAIVAWLDENPGADDLKPIMADARYFYEGQPLTEADLDRELEYLLAKGLVTGDDQIAEVFMIDIKLTAEGVDCMAHGGSVNDYLRRNDGGSGNTTVNFNREVSGNVAWQNQGGVTQTTNVGASADQLGELIGALRQALPVLGLDDADVQRLQGQLDIAGGEIESLQPDAGVVKSVLRRVLDKIDDTGISMLGTVLTAYAKHLMLQAGVPLEPGQ